MVTTSQRNPITRLIQLKLWIFEHRRAQDISNIIYSVILCCKHCIRYDIHNLPNVIMVNSTYGVFGGILQRAQLSLGMVTTQTQYTNWYISQIQVDNLIYIVCHKSTLFHKKKYWKYEP